jgi:hypothetical protein
VPIAPRRVLTFRASQIMRERIAKRRLMAAEPQRKSDLGLSDDRRAGGRARGAAAYPALLGDALSAAAAAAARRQPPLLPARRRRAGAAHPPPAQSGRLYDPRRPAIAAPAQTAADGPFAPTPPAGAYAITCARASIVPGEHDEEVILAHMPLIITQSAGPIPHRAAALGFSGGHFTYTMRTGTLTPAEQAAVDARLAEFLARVHPSSAPAH